MSAGDDTDSDLEDGILQKQQKINKKMKAEIKPVEPISASVNKSAVIDLEDDAAKIKQQFDVVTIFDSDDDDKKNKKAKKKDKELKAKKRKRSRYFVTFISFNYW